MVFSVYFRFMRRVFLFIILFYSSIFYLPLSFVPFVPSGSAGCSAVLYENKNKKHTVSGGSTAYVIGSCIFYTDLLSFNQDCLGNSSLDGRREKEHQSA